MATPDPPGAPGDAATVDKNWQEWYWKQAEPVQQDINSGTDSLDKNMLALSSGALGVSLAFIKDIVPLGQATWICLLIISWCAFALCMTTTLLSFEFSIAGLKKHRDLLDEMLKAKNPELAKNQGSGWSRAVVVCRHTALILFLAGLACTVVFVIKNVSSFHAAGTANTPDAAITNIGTTYMSGEENRIEKVAKPEELQRGREPMKLTPPPKATPVAPAPCPTKEEK